MQQWCGAGERGELGLGDAVNSDHFTPRIEHLHVARRFRALPMTSKRRGSGVKHH